MGTNMVDTHVDGTNVMLTCELPRSWHVSERQTEISQVLVAPVVDGRQVLPLFDGRGQVHGVQGNLELAWTCTGAVGLMKIFLTFWARGVVLTLLVGGGESVVVVHGEHQGLVESFPKEMG